MALVDKVIAYNLEIKSALLIMYDALNPGQQEKILKDEKVKALFERYGVEVNE